MHEVHIDSGPPPRSYSTFAEAVSGAEQHPGQERAAAATRALGRTRAIGGSWSTAACSISFSNDRLLAVQARNFQLSWRVQRIAESQGPSSYEPVKLVWNSELTSVFDPHSLLGQVGGTEFSRLFVNEMGLLLYTRGNPILWFHALRIRDSGQDLLFASLEE